MGRSRRRNRRVLGGVAGNDDDSSGREGQDGAVPVETLAPTYVSVGAEWESADVVAPVLALDGLKPWEEIRGPALMLEEEPEATEALVAEVDDPQQLELTPAAAAAEQPDDRAAIEQPIAPAEEIAPEPEPDAAELLFDEAQAAAAADRPEEAKRLYRQVLALRGAHVRARNNLALLLDGAGDHAAALAELDRALEYDAENPTVLVNRGALLGAAGRFAAAERDLKRVLRTEPAHAEALFNLGVVMTKKGLWAEAVPHLRRAIELEPGRSAAHFYLGEALNHVDDLTGAMLAYQRAAELQPNHPRALYGLGIVYDRLGRPDDAARMYRRSREVGRR